MLEGLLFDAQATRGALAAWMKVNRDGTNNHSTSRKYVDIHSLNSDYFDLWMCPDVTSVLYMNVTMCLSYVIIIYHLRIVFKADWLYTRVI